MADCGRADPGVFGHRCDAFRPVPAVREAGLFQIRALCIDGPIRGQVITLPQGTPCYYVIDDRAADPADLWLAPGARPVPYTPPPVIIYYLSRFGFRSGGTTVMLRIAQSVPGEPDARDLAGLLLSDAAKQALIP